MRSIIDRENLDPIRPDELYLRQINFRQRLFSGAALSVASVQIEDEDGTVFAADLDRLAGFGALVEQVEARFRIVVGNPFADGLTRWPPGFHIVKWRPDARYMNLSSGPSFARS